MLYKFFFFSILFTQKITPASAEFIDITILNYIIKYPLSTLYVIDFNNYYFPLMDLKALIYQVIYGFLVVDLSIFNHNHRSNRWFAIRLEGSFTGTSGLKPSWIVYQPHFFLRLPLKWCFIFYHFYLFLFSFHLRLQI